MANPLEAFRKNAKLLMRSRGLNQTQAAKFLGWDQGHLSAYLSKREPGLDKIAEFAAAFGVTVAEILSDTTQSQITPRVVEPTPLEALELVRKKLLLVESLPPELLALLGKMDSEQLRKLTLAAGAVLRNKTSLEEVG